MHSGSAETGPACADLAQTHRAQPPRVSNLSPVAEGPELGSNSQYGQS